MPLWQRTPRTSWRSSHVASPSCVTLRKGSSRFQPASWRTTIHSPSIQARLVRASAGRPREGGSMNRSRLLRFMLYSSLLLFFLQALRVILSVMFGVIYDGIFVGPIGPWMIASNLLLFLAMLAPLAAPRRSAPKLEAVIVSAVGVAPPPPSLDDAPARVSGGWGGVPP